MPDGEETRLGGEEVSIIRSHEEEMSSSGKEVGSGRGDGVRWGGRGNANGRGDGWEKALGKLDVA